MNKYLSLVKFSHTVFALPFALLGFVWGLNNSSEPFDWRVLIGVVICMVTARNAAMAFNRLVDAKFDKLNPRTAVREIPSGAISPRAAAIFTVINIIFFIFCASQINSLTALLSPVAIAVILGYSLVKRVSWVCHYVLGLALGIAPVAAYISVTGKIDMFVVILSVIVITWVSSFDILYALQDEQFDKENRLHSIPAKFGRKGALIISTVVHLITIFFLLRLGSLYSMGLLYWIGAAIFSIILLIEHAIVTPSNISRINLAFATLNSLGSLIFCTLAILSLILG